MSDDEVDLTHARLRDDAYWAQMSPLEARVITESARKSAQLELSLIDQERYDYKALPRDPDEYREQMQAFGARRRKALVFLNLVERRQNSLKLRKVKEIEWAVVQHRFRTLRDGITPTDHDEALWSLVREQWRNPTEGDMSQAKEGGSAWRSMSDD